MLRRVELLPDETRQVLALASILGKGFYDEDLEHLVRGEADLGERDLDRALETLTRRQLLVRDPRSRGDRWSFPNGVVREVVYQGLRATRRRRLHRRHAEQLEERFLERGRLEQVLPKLVEHFAAAEMGEKTVACAVRLAERSLAACCPEEAVHALQTALRLVAEVSGGHARKAEVLALLARARRSGDDLEQALVDAAKAWKAFHDAGDLESSWREGCVGTGPFRVARFVPGREVVLERNPHYWRPGLPKSGRLEFHLGFTPEEAFAELEAGRFSLAMGLSPRHVEVLCRDPRFGGPHPPVPRLATYFLLLNARRGPFADLAVRRAFVRALDVGRLLRDAGGRQMEAASGLIPPPLLGGERSGPRRRASRVDFPGLRLRVALHPAYGGTYAPFFAALREGLEERDVALDAEVLPLTEILGPHREVPDLFADRWLADYPDPDGFVGSLLHSTEGAYAGFFGSDEVDRLIEKGRRETDPGERRAVYREIEDLLAREALLVPLFHEQTYCFTSPGVRGLRLSLTTPEVFYEELESEGGK